MPEQTSLKIFYNSMEIQKKISFMSFISEFKKKNVINSIKNSCLKKIMINIHISVVDENAWKWLSTLIT